MQNIPSDLAEQLRSARQGRRDPLTPPKTDFAPEPRLPRLWLFTGVLAALGLALIVLSYVVTIAPAHLIVIGTPIVWILWRLWRQRHVSVSR